MALRKACLSSDPSSKLKSKQIIQSFCVWIALRPVFLQTLQHLLIFFFSYRLLVAWLKIHDGLFTEAKTETAAVGVVQGKSIRDLEQWIKAHSLSYVTNCIHFLANNRPHKCVFFSFFLSLQYFIFLCNFWPYVTLYLAVSPLCTAIAGKCG